VGRRTLRERSWGEPGGCRRTGHIREDAARSRVGTSFVCSTQLPRITPLAPKIAEAFDHEAFAFELKHDGWRGLLQLDRRGSAGFISRADRALRRFDSLAMAIAETLPVENAVLDGEVVCLDAEGRSQFSGLSRRSVQPLFYCFDILWLDGEDLRDETLRKRRELLRVLLPRQGVDVFLADQVIGKGVKLRRGLPARPRGDRRQAARLALSARARQESRVQGAQPGVLAVGCDRERLYAEHMEALERARRRYEATRNGFRRATAALAQGVRCSRTGSASRRRLRRAPPET